MPISSTRFETTLTPEPQLRKWLLVCGCLATMAGTLIILSLPVAWIPRLMFTMAWAGENLHEFRRLLRGAARLQALRLDAAGNIAGLGPDGCYEPLTLLSGSVVVSGLAWFRVRFADGSEYAELFRGDPARDREWQRLQLIWRYRQGAFGRPDGS